MDPNLRLIVFAVLFVVLVVAFSVPACENRQNKFALDMAAKGYCWEREETQTNNTWRPCRAKVSDAK